VRQAEFAALRIGEYMPSLVAALSERSPAGLTSKCRRSWPVFGRGQDWNAIVGFAPPKPVSSRPLRRVGIPFVSTAQHLDELPEREQRALILRFYGNLTQAEIGQRLGISQMHVSRLLTRALAYLRGKLTGEPDVVREVPS
jgi:predicted DNA-binding protein (UPF0251 family)